MTFKLLKSETLFHGRAFTIRRDTLLNPEGRETLVDIVVHIGSVVILPVNTKGDLLFVRQYRHAAGLNLLELPAGTLDAGEAPDVCAQRELREETGMAAGRLLPLGGFYLAPGYSTEYMHVFLATDLHADALDPDADEFLCVEAIPLAEAIKMAGRGEIPDAKTLAAMLLAREQLEKLP